MGNRYPYDRDPYGPRRRPVERDTDDIRSWSGDDEAAYRRQRDERERDRWEEDARAAGGFMPRRPPERSGDVDRSSDRRPGWWGDVDRDREYMRDRPDRDYGWRHDDNSTTYIGMSHGHYAEPGHLGRSEYGPQSYGGPYGRERPGAREWSSVEGWRVPGPHTGRGPRGYQRADDRVRDEINERLTAHGLIDASDVECRVVNGEVTLAGFVDSRAAKRAAADLAEDVYGVREVHNQLRVRSHGDDGGVGRTSVLGLTETQLQTTNPPAAPAADAGRPRTRS
jgi:hypothetical protein